MYSIIGTAFAAIDFAKDNVEDGVINSPPSHGTGRTLVYLPSSLWGYNTILALTWES